MMPFQVQGRGSPWVGAFRARLTFRLRIEHAMLFRFGLKTI